MAGTPDNPVVCSMAEAMCGECQRRIVLRGWRAEDQRNWGGHVDFHTCAACQDGIRRLASRHGAVQFNVYRGISERQYRELRAMHEAAHAVVGEALGLVMTEASVEFDEVELFGAPTTRGGTVEWDRSRRIRIPAWAGMASAGNVLELEWQRRNGLDVARYAIDAAYTSGIDTASIMINAERGGTSADDLMTRGYELANAVVTEDWAQITAVSEELGRTKRMDRVSMLAAMERARPSRTTRTPALAPAVSAAPVAVSASIPATTGGSAMSGIDEIRSAVAQADADSEQAIAAMQQANQLLEQVRNRLTGVLGESSRPEAQQALGQFGQVIEQLPALITGVHSATEAARSYSASL